jgi:hypothetical protein
MVCILNVYREPREPQPPQQCAEFLDPELCYREGMSLVSFLFLWFRLRGSDNSMVRINLLLDPADIPGLPPPRQQELNGWERWVVEVVRALCRRVPHGAEIDSKHAGVARGGAEQVATWGC